LNLVVDGNVFDRDNQGGIPRIYTEILPRMVELDNSLNITLLTPAQTYLSLPKHKNISILSLPKYETNKKPAIYWDNLWGLNRYRIIKQRARNLKKTIWHSTSIRPQEMERSSSLDGQ
jgi:hypothetical protein